MGDVVVTLTRRRLHSVQAIDALFSLPSSVLEPVPGPSGKVARGRMGRRALDGPG